MPTTTELTDAPPPPMMSSLKRGRTHTKEDLRIFTLNGWNRFRTYAVESIVEMPRRGAKVVRSALAAQLWRTSDGELWHKSADALKSDD